MPALEDSGTSKGSCQPLLNSNIFVREADGDMDTDSPGYTFTSRFCKTDITYAPVETLDYDDADTLISKANFASGSPFNSFVYAALKWSFCFVTAVLVAACGILVNVSVENLAGAKFSWTLTTMEESYFLSFCVYAFFNCTLVLFASCLVVYFGPAAAGSGIPDVKAYLNGINMPGVLLPVTLLTKMAGCICAVAGGLAVGKEGPFVHIGSCIASLLTNGGTKHLKLRHRWMDMLANDPDRRDMVTCGSTAGVAAAFRSPVGGVLFALEEASSWWNNSVLWRAFFTTAVVSVSLRVMIKWCGSNNCGYFGSGGYIIFEISQGQVDYQLMELFPMLLLGLLGGVLGSTFNSLSAQLCTWRRDVLGRFGPSYRIAEAVGVAFIGSLVSFTLPFMATCKPCPTNPTTPCPRTEDHGSYIAFNCAHPQEYNDLAALFFNTQDNAIRALFSSNTGHEYSVFTLTTFFLFFYALSILTYGVAVPSGLFVPSILCGATYGRLVGMLMTELNGSKDIDEGTYALLGAASFLGGAMRMTVSLCVILLELTNNLNLLPLMMLVLLVAKAIGDSTGIDAVYDVHVKLKRLPFLGSSPPEFMSHLTAGEAATPAPVSFQRVTPVRVIAEVLQACDHNAFPVFEKGPDGQNSFMGIVLRSHVLALIQERRCLQESPSPVSGKELSSKLRGIVGRDLGSAPAGGDVPLAKDQLELYVDLGLCCNVSTHVVQEGASLGKVYRQFRQLGLRHLVVVPRAGEVVGILTRKDLLPGMLERRFPELRHRMPHGAGSPGTVQPDFPPGGALVSSPGALSARDPRSNRLNQRKQAAII